MGSAEQCMQNKIFVKCKTMLAQKTEKKNNGKKLKQMPLECRAEAKLMSFQYLIMNRIVAVNQSFNLKALISVHSVLKRTKR